MVNRKQFLHLSAASAAALVLPALLSGNETSNPTANTRLADVALNAARSKGAAYADVRITRVKNAGAYEAGIRTIVGGHWGFASTTNMTRQGIENCVQQAVANATRHSNRHQYDLKLPHELWRCALLK